MVCQSKTYGGGVKRVSLHDTLPILGLQIPTSSPLTQKEDEVRQQLHNVVAVEVATAVLHMVYRARSLSKEKEPKMIGPVLVVTIAVHKLENMVDPIN